MSLLCLLSLALSWMLGGVGISAMLAAFISPALCVMAFSSGAVIGAEGTLSTALRRMGARVLLLPVLIGLGSVVAGGAMGIIMGMRPGPSLAAAAGFGWYSLPAAIIARLGPYDHAALCFMAGLIREVAAFVIIPPLARRYGAFAAIAPAGATAMDTALPLITRAAGSGAAVAAVVTGFCLTAAAPLLVELLYRLF